jgi:hypothetical protein
MKSRIKPSRFQPYRDRETRKRGKKWESHYEALFTTVSVNSLGRDGNENPFFGNGFGNELKKTSETRG